MSEDKNIPNQNSKEQIANTKEKNVNENISPSLPGRCLTGHS